MALLQSNTIIYGTANVYSNLTVGSVTSNTSTNVSTGSLIVVGGVGVSGNLYAGNVYSNNALVLTSEPYGNAAFGVANSAASFANGAFTAANTKLSASGFTNNGVLYANGTGYAVNSSALTFDGTNLGINTYSILASTTFTTSTTTANQIIYSMPTATYRSAKLMVQITSGTSYQVTELLIIHDGTNAFMTQYGDVATTGTSLGTFDSSITSGNLNLLFTPTNAATTVKLSSSLIVL